MTQNGRRHWQGAASSKAPNGAQWRSARAKLSLRGTGFKTFFTIAPGARYLRIMILIAAAALLGAAPDSGKRPVSAVQARATVRIVRAARLNFGGGPDTATPPLRPRTIQTAEGPRPAKLIEFE